MADVCEDDSRPAPVPFLQGWFETQVTLTWAVRIADSKFSIDFGRAAHPSLDVTSVLQLFAD